VNVVENVNSAEFARRPGERGTETLTHLIRSRGEVLEGEELLPRRDARAHLLRDLHDCVLGAVLVAD
jgi:hypothetical protein